MSDTETFHRAVQANDKNQVSQWLESGEVPVNVVDPVTGATGLVLAASAGHVGVVGLLLDAGADTEVVDAEGDTALLHAARGGHHRIVDLLLKRRARVNHVNNQGQTALHEAARGNCVKCLEVLLENKASIWLLDHKGNQARDVAFSAGHTTTAIELLTSPLGVFFRAARENNAGRVFRMLAADVPVEARDGDTGETALLAAARCGCEDVVRELVNHGANVDAADSTMKDTGLHWAARKDDTNLAQLLLEHRAGPDSLNMWARTPLHEAAMLGNNPGVTELLMRYRANTSLLDNRGQTAGEIAEAAQKNNIAQTLKRVKF